MITKDEGYLDQYKEIYILSEKEKSVVSLVMDEINKRVAVKKVIRKSRPDIYHVIKGLASEHIPKIYHILEEKDNLTIIEEYVEGSTLQEYLQSENILTADRFFDLLYQICEVLELLHGLPHPIIHRDIKPSNIIVTSQGLLKLIDYDSAREYKKESDKDTVCLGTIEYASPEQFGYSQTDMRSDIYSVGILISACMKYNLELETKPRFKTAVQKVIDRCTMFDPLQRYQNMNELEKDLRTAQKKLNTRNRRRYTVLFASGLSCLLVLAALYYNWQGHNATTSDQSMTDQVTDGEGKVPGQKNTADDNVSLEADKASTEDIISLPVPNNFGLNQDASVSNTDIITEPAADNTHTADAYIREAPVQATSQSTEDSTQNLQDSGASGNIASNSPIDISGASKEKTPKDSAKDSAVTVASSDRTGELTDTDVSDNSTEAPGAIPAEIPADESADEPSDIHYVVTVNNAEIVNIGSEYYKNDTYREDLKFYIKYNDASKVKSLFIQSLGSVRETNYTVEGNIITIKKEYLDTLLDGIYDLNVNMDQGNPAIARFTVHPKEEESEYGFYRLSSYYWDFHLSDSKDFTFLVFNCKEARITGLRNGSVDIDPQYYKLDDNGYTATLYQSYMAGMEEGIRFNLVVEFSDGMEKTIGVRIRYKEVIGPILNPAFNIFDKSKPEDVEIKIIWNDAKFIKSIDPEIDQDANLSSGDYTLENDAFTIKKEFLETLDAGIYIWYLLFDTETGFQLKLQVND